MLQPFKDAMMDGEHAKLPTLNMVLSHYEMLMAHMEVVAVPTWLQDGADDCLERLKQYFSYTSNFLYLATCLDPRFKMSSFGNDLAEGAVPYAEVQDVVTTKLKKYFEAPPVVTLPIPPPPSSLVSLSPSASPLD